MGQTTGDRKRAPAAEALRRVAAVRDDPEDRYRLAKAFYDSTTGPEIEGYGRAELAFMRWEIERGVLNAPHARPRPGSPWWRAVNERIIRDALEASLVAGSAGAEASSPAVGMWLTFLSAPSPVTWYRAHNASVLGGYSDASHLAAREGPYEQFLMNLVLARVLYAQALAEGEPFAVGSDPLIARFLSDPRSPAVPVVMELPDFYPRTYPLDALEESLMERRARSSEEEALALIDQQPCENLEELFAFASKSLGLADVGRFIDGKLPCYPHGLIRDPDPQGRARWLPWLAPELSEGSRWSDSLLDRMRHVADPEADDVVASYFEDSADAAPHRFFRLLVHTMELPPQECSPAVAEYLAERPALPRWADPDLMRTGEEFFDRWGLYVPLVLVCSSLPECYAAKKGVQVLQLTARLATDPKRRIVETAQMVLDVMAPGGMQPGARGYGTVRRVRLMHAGVRYLIQNDPRIARDAAAADGARWSSDWGVPINQEDLAGTLTTFSWSVLVGLAALGVPVSDDEQEAFIHVWNVVGAMLGLREELLPKDARDAAALSSRIRERQWEESPEGREMTEALLEMLEKSLPGRLIPGFGPSMIRHFVGDDLAEQLGVPKHGRAGSLFRSASLAANAAGLTQQRSWVFRKTAAAVSRGLLQTYMRFDRGGDRPGFDIPRSLAGVRGTIITRPRIPRMGRR
ncbi:MAG: oxygenase MpaB family protein [Actinomycetota bacterium]